MRVSSVVKYAFASHLNGCLPIMTEGVLCSACSRVKAAFRPTRGRRFSETNTVRLSTAGYSARTVPRVASPEALRRGLVRSDLLPRGTWTRSVRPSEAGVSRRGNSGMPTYESKWHERVGFNPVPRTRSVLVCERIAERFVNAVNGGAFSSYFRDRPHPTSLGLTTSLVEGGILMWFSSSVGATGRLVRPAYRTPFGVSKPTIRGRATAARTARRLWPHSTVQRHGRAQLNGCLPLCRSPLRPTRSWFETHRVSSSH